MAVEAIPRSDERDGGDAKQAEEARGRNGGWMGRRRVRAIRRQEQQAREVSSSPVLMSVVLICEVVRTMRAAGSTGRSSAVVHEREEEERQAESDQPPQHATKKELASIAVVDLQRELGGAMSVIA